MKGTSDNKSEENRPPLKLNFKGVVFLQFYCQMLPKAFSVIAADFHVLQGDYILDCVLNPGVWCFGSRLCVEHFFLESRALGWSHWLRLDFMNIFV